jgi:hypothetical protein
MGVVPTASAWLYWMALAHQKPVLPEESLTLMTPPAAPVVGVAEMVGAFGVEVWLA